MSVRRKLAALIAQTAAARLRRRHPEWADALASEQAHLPPGEVELAWAVGSLRAALALEDAYPVLLACGVGAMALYQWSADESLVTLSLMGAICLLLGGLRPSRVVATGVAVGVVVAAVNAFETFSGLRPAYEIHRHSWSHDLRWLLLVPPAVLGSALGGRVSSLLSDLP